MVTPGKFWNVMTLGDVSARVKSLAAGKQYLLPEEMPAPGSALRAILAASILQRDAANDERMQT
jgi:hypothetical protein